MKTNLFVIAFLLVLACHLAQSQKTTKNPTSKKPKPIPTKKGKPTERQDSKTCEQGTPLKFVPSDAKTLLANPERGFYHHHEIKFSPHRPIGKSDIKEWTKDGVTLALMIFNLEPFVKKDLTEAALKNMASDFKTLREGGMKAIVRFSYNQKSLKDPDNYNFPKTTDAEKPQLLRHIDQLKEIFKDNADVINVVQIGFIGHWGEWYYSKNYAKKKDGGWSATPEQQKDRKEIVKALMKAVPDIRMLQIRYPAEKQKMYGEANTEPNYGKRSEVSRLGIHNDCFLADKTDTGTFRDEKDRNYLEKEGLSVMVGGETCQASTFSECPNAKKQIEKQRFTYLNSEFNEKVIKKWRDDNCYKYIGNKIGYRFELVSGKLQSTVKKGSSFCGSLQINNTGVAPLYNARPLEVILRKGSQKWKIAQPNIDPRKFIPGKVTTININVSVPSEASPGKYDVILNLPDKAIKDSKYSILFANGGKVQDINERFNVIGQITIQ